MLIKSFNNMVEIFNIYCLHCGYKFKLIFSAIPGSNLKKKNVFAFNIHYFYDIFKHLTKMKADFLLSLQKFF